MDLKSQINQTLSDTLFEELIRYRRHLHSHPELSFEEVQTSAFIRNILDQWHIDYSYPLVNTGFVASVKGNKPGKLIALRTDMDALPIEEATGLEYASRNKGVMHACGHDIHMTSMLGVIKILHELRNLLSGEILFIFQPGEEKVPGGANLMLREGVFQEKKPEMILAQHVLPEMESGKAGFKPGMYMASSDEIYLTVKGKGGHGALPETIIDPVLMTSHILISLQQEINRKSPKGIPTVLSFGKVSANGAVNVIPDQVTVEGTFRTMDESWRKEAHNLIERIAGGIAQGMGGSVDIEIRHGYPVLHNDEEITASAKKYAAELLGKENVLDMTIRMTAEDFAWFLQDVPGMMYRLGVKDPGSEKVYPLHTPEFSADESALRTGITLLAFLACKFAE